jgi:hypothetical protein
MFWLKTIKSTQRRLAAINTSQSVLISILHFIGRIPWPTCQKKKRGRPYEYPPTVILRCFVVRIWLRLDSNRALHDFLAIMDHYPYHQKIMKACELTSLPDRRTFDRRLAKISVDIKERISTMGNLFVKEKLLDPYIVTIDSTLLKAKGHLWHKSSMIKRVVPRSGIDTDARWGFSHSKGSYKMLRNKHKFFDKICVPL